jgi:hypothetical protein
MVQRMIDSGRAATLACFAHCAEAPNPLQRQAMANFIERNKQELQRLDRFALVIDSAVHRRAIAVLSWLVRKPFQERIFNSPLAAIQWLAEPHAELDPEAIRAAIVDRVPLASLWPSFGSAAPDTVDTLRRP